MLPVPTDGTTGDPIPAPTTPLPNYPNQVITNEPGVVLPLPNLLHVISFDCFENFINLAIHKTLLLPPSMESNDSSKGGAVFWR